jgi:hypothetical protein
MTALERVHRHHEGQGGHTVDRQGQVAHSCD